MKTDNYLQIGMMKHLSPFEYMILQYLMFRSNLSRWNIRLEDIEKNTSVSIGKIHNVMSDFVERGLATKDEYHHYHLNLENINIYIHSFSQDENQVSQDENGLSRHENDFHGMKGTDSTEKKVLKEISTEITKVQEKPVGLIINDTIKINVPSSIGVAVPPTTDKEDKVDKAISRVAITLPTPGQPEKKKKYNFHQMLIDQVKQNKSTKTPW